MTPTELEALYPKEVVDAWWTVKIYARHIANGGGSSFGDVQTLDALGGPEYSKVIAAMDILRQHNLLLENLFVPAPKPYRRGTGNFVVRDLSVEHAKRYSKWSRLKSWIFQAYSHRRG